MKQTILNGKIIEDYSDDYPFPSVLIAYVDKNKPLHVLVAYAVVCEQCGEEWISDSNADKLESIVSGARDKHTMIEVANFSDFLKVAS